MSFSCFFAYITKELLTKSYMATNDIDKDMNRDRGWYVPPTGRCRGLLAFVAGKGIRLPSPPPVGRGLNVPQLGKGRGLRPPSCIVLDLPQLLSWEAEL